MRETTKKRDTADKSTQTLDEFMATVSADQIVHIGCSSGFVFIGNRKTYKKDIDRISDGFRDEYVDRLTATAARLARNCSMPLLRRDNEECTQYSDRIIEIAKQIRRDAVALPDLRDIVKTFKPMRDRLVASSYDRLEGDGIVVIIDGCEGGQFWFADEYEAAKKGAKK